MKEQGKQLKNKLSGKCLKAMQTTNNVQETENKKMRIKISKTLSVLSIKLGQTDLMVGCWMSRSGSIKPGLERAKVIISNKI